MTYIKYPHLWKKCGVYKILNKENGKFYIGSSFDISRRWIFHTCLLRRGIHYTPKLQEDWNNFGENSFEIYILEECLLEECKDKEQEWLNETKAVELGYNYQPDSRSVKGMKRSKEVCDKISFILKEKWKDPEKRKEFSEKLKKTNRENIVYRNAKIARLIKQNKDPEFIRKNTEKAREKRKLQKWEKHNI